MLQNIYIGAIFLCVFCTCFNQVRCEEEAAGNKKHPKVLKTNRPCDLAHQVQGSVFGCMDACIKKKYNAFDCYGPYHRCRCLTLNSPEVAPPSKKIKPKDIAHHKTHSDKDSDDKKGGKAKKGDKSKSDKKGKPPSEEEEEEEGIVAPGPEPGYR